MGTIGPADADILITLGSDHRPIADYVTTLRRKLLALFPSTTFAFLPADITTQILNFGLPAPIDVQIAGKSRNEDWAYAQALLKRIARVPGTADVRMQQADDEPTLKVDVDRTLAEEIGITERNIATSLQDTLAGSIQTQPIFWLNPRNGVSYPVAVQTPQYDIDSVNSLANTPLNGEGGEYLLGGLAQIKMTGTPAVVSHCFGRD